METKICSRCGKEKESNEYRCTFKYGKSYQDTFCIKCLNERRRELYVKNIKSNRDKKKIWRAEMKEESKKKIQEANSKWYLIYKDAGYYRKWKMANPEKTMNWKRKWRTGNPEKVKIENKKITSRLTDYHIACNLKIPVEELRVQYPELIESKRTLIQMKREIKQSQTI